MPTTKQLAWAAGFLEGEGSFQAARTTPTVVCSQVQREPLERLLSMFGGKIIPLKHKTGRPGKDYFRWYLNGGPAAGVAMTMFGMMSPRRQDQIEKMLDIWKAAPRKATSHCSRGHERTAANTYISASGRHCRVCKLAPSVKE